MSFVRRVTGYDYPRFHAYVNTENNQMLIINLHLDQKQPSYGHGTHAHGGDYDSEIVVAEAARIKQCFAGHAPHQTPHQSKHGAGQAPQSGDGTGHAPYTEGSGTG